MASDYYATLGVDPEADSEEIRRAYRTRALERHPDRNGGSPEAEEAFKELTEAYAVLGDPRRRAAYDARRRSGSTGPSADPGDLFADLFGHPAFAGLFAQLSREFARQGLRFDEPYLRKVFSGRRHGVMFGGFVFVWPWGGLSPFIKRDGAKTVSDDAAGGSVLPRRGTGFLRQILGRTLPRPKPQPTLADSDVDIRYTLPLSPDILQAGGKVRIAVPGAKGVEKYDVAIPAGARNGVRLRLPGRGLESAHRRGDLYLEITEQA